MTRDLRTAGLATVAEPFWDATRTRATSCCRGAPRASSPIWYPRDVCPSCLGSCDRVAAGIAGTASCTPSACTTCRARAATRAELPYAVALIDLAEGVRMMSNVVDMPARRRCTSAWPCASTWQPLSDGRNLPQFAPR